MNRKIISYSERELAWIKSNCTLPRKQRYQEFIALFGRDDISIDNLNALCKRKRWLTGRTGRIEPGSTPPNKGKKIPFNPNSAKTQFKKGHRPHNTKYPGHERINTQGYVEISIAQENPHTGAKTRYVFKHRYLWEKLHGPVPEGKALKCLDGNKANTEPANWKLIDRAILPRLNGIYGRDYDNAPAEIKPAILATCEIEQKLADIGKRIS